MPYEYYELRDQRALYRLKLTNLNADTNYIIGVSFFRVDTNETTERFFKFKTLPADSSPLIISVTSNRLDSEDQETLRLQNNTVTSVQELSPDMVIIQGNIAYDFGFSEGYFLYDLFFKKYAGYCSKDSCTPRSLPEIVPFLIVPGRYDYSQRNVEYEDFARDLNIDVFFP